MVLWIWMVIWTFFGWSWGWDGKNIPQDVSTWFVDIINDTGGVSDVQLDDSQGNGYIQINVMMPKYFYNSGWKKFAQDLYESLNIYMNFVFVDNLNSYRDQLYDSNFSGADLFLYPYDWNEKVSIRAFSAEQNMQPYFDELLSSILRSDRLSFVPFAADPMVTYVYSGLSAYDFHEISELVFNWEPINPLSFPLFFGINIEDLDDSWFVWEYQDIVRYALLHYFKENNDSINLDLWINSNVLEKYNIPDLRTISNAISAPECKAFPSLCFQLYNFVWVRFWFLSDRDVVNTYFTWKKANLDKLTVSPVPFSQLESPVRIRWWWIRGSLDDKKKINAIYKLIEQYMTNHSQYNLRNSTLPVFRSIGEWNWLWDNEYIWLRWYVLQAGWDYVNSLRSMTRFKELLWHDITAKEYLR